MSSNGAPDRERRTVWLIGMLLGFEQLVYAVLIPVLAHYEHKFAASKTAIGVLAAAYPAGTLLGAPLGGWVATRAGVRRTTVVALLVFTAAIAPFGFSESIAVLDGLRFIQGVASGAIWSAGLAWVIATAPSARRGALIGSVLAWAVFGALLGTVLGTLADVIGTEIAFVGVGVLALCLTAWTFSFQEPPRTSLGGAAPPRALISDRRFILGLWLIVLAAGAFGATSTLLPLRLSLFGASDVAIGVIFVLAALGETLVSPWMGRVIDRRGIAVPLAVGLAVSGLLIAALPLPPGALPLAVLIVAFRAPLMAPQIGGMSLMTDEAERIGAALVLSAMLFNLAWAIGEAVGAPAAATLSQATSDAVPLALLAAVILLTILLVLRSRSPARPGVPTADVPPPVR